LYLFLTAIATATGMAKFGDMAIFKWSVQCVIVKMEIAILSVCLMHNAIMFAFENIQPKGC
jgi:hypothetical protein